MAGFKVGLHPNDLARYTFPLLFLHLRAWHRAQREEWERTALLGSILINQWAGRGQRRVTPGELLGDAPPPSFHTPEAFRRFMRKRIAEDDTRAEPHDAIFSDEILSRLEDAADG